MTPAWMLPQAWFKDIAVSPVTIPLLSFSMKPSRYYQKNFPDLEFDTLEDAEASFIAISVANKRQTEKVVDYQLECLDKGIDENPLKIKKMRDESSRLHLLKRAIEDIIDQFNKQPA